MTDRQQFEEAMTDIRAKLPLAIRNNGGEPVTFENLEPILHRAVAYELGLEFGSNEEIFVLNILRLCELLRDKPEQ